MSRSGQPDDPVTLLNQGYRYALALVHDRTKAEDLLQDAWLAVLQAGGAREKAYLFSAIRSRYINQGKRDKLVAFVPLDNLHDITDAGTGDAMESRLQMDELERLLQQLRPPEREALFLAAVEGYTAQEIADHTGYSRGTVLSLIHRARKKLMATHRQQPQAVTAR